MSKVLCMVLLGLCVVRSWADDRKAVPDKKELARNDTVSLKIGDPAPALRADKWLQGQPVQTFQSGHIYVVDFWATWCGPCIASMPHTAELAEQYRDKNVTIIAFTTRDPDNSEEKFAAFVKKRGPNLPFTFAYTDNPATFDAWMKAAGREGIPCAFVVDKSGRIAYFGHPMYLGAVLPRVAAGTATAQEVGAEMSKMENELQGLFDPKDPPSTLQAVASFETRYPALANTLPFLRAKLSWLPKYGKPGEARQFAETVMAKAMEQHDAFALSMISHILRNGDGKESKGLLEVALKAAEAQLQIDGDDNAFALLNLAQAHAATGERARARYYAQKAVAAAAHEPAARKESIEKAVKELENGKEDKK